MDRVLYVAGGEAALGTVDEVINSESLSKLYHAKMKVLSRWRTWSSSWPPTNHIIEHGEHFH